MRFGRFVAKGEQGEERILGIPRQWGGRAFRGSATGEGVERGKFIAKFEDDSLRRLFAEALEFGQGGGVSGGHGIADGGWGGAGENGKGGFWADSGDVMKQEAEEIAFSRGEEAVERVVILPNHQMGEKPDFFLRCGEAVVGGDRDENFVAQAVAVDYGMCGPSLVQGAFEESDHLRSLPKRAARKRRSGGGG